MAVVLWKLDIKNFEDKGSKQQNGGNFNCCNWHKSKTEAKAINDCFCPKLILFWLLFINDN